MSDGATAFVATAEAAAYVPYAGAERALATLEEWACDAEGPVCVLRGPEGAGKSMLLAVLAARVGRHAVPVSVSARGLDPETLAHRLLDALGTPWEGSPRVALARAVERPGVRRLLLLLDDGDALVPRTEMWLFDFVRRSAGAVRALLAVRDARLAAELAAAFQAGTRVLALDAAMSREETEAWVRAELTRGGVDDALRARFDAPTVGRLHTRSGGLPGRLRQMAAAILADIAGDDRREAPPAAVRREEPPRVPVGHEGSPSVAATRDAASAVTAPPPAPRAPRPAPTPAEDPKTVPASASPLRPVAPRHEPASREPALREPRAPAARTPREPAPPGPGSPRAAARPRRDSLLRWLLVPAALAVAYVAGFVTAQVLGVVRPEPTPERVAVEAGVVTATDPELLRPAMPPPPVAEPPAAPFAPSPRAGGAAPFVLAEPSPVSADEPALPPVSAPPPGAPVALAGAEGEASIAEPAASELAPAAAAARAAPAALRRPAPPPAPRRVAVSVEAEPGAAVLIDGRPVGVGSVDGLELPPGPYRVEVRLTDGRVVERVVEVRGTRYEVKVR